MRRSFVRLVVRSVLVGWAVGMLIIFLYIRGLSWTEDRARRDGVFLVHEMLDRTAEDQRGERLRELQPHFSVHFALATRAQVELQTGGPITPGEWVWHRVSRRQQWYFLAFGDGRGALAAGPVDPVIPRDVIPVGAILALVGVPIIAGLIALSVERELTKVERASQAIAVGELGARVDNAAGPSKELAASFNAMAERVERLVRSRDELVQAVSHELGSPLSRLRFHVALLQSTSESERDERINAMTRELDALDELVAELLSYVQSDEHDLKPQVFDPAQGLQDLAELARLEAPPDRPVDVQVDIRCDVRVTADPKLFLRANENILRNAVQHGQGRVRLEVKRDEDHIRVEVHDDGPGIPEALREKVMIPFYRPETARGRKTGGVGLGMAIVGRIMNRHGGRVEIGSSPLGGARVSTLWPRQ